MFSKYDFSMAKASKRSALFKMTKEARKKLELEKRELAVKRAKRSEEKMEKKLKKQKELLEKYKKKV